MNREMLRTKLNMSQQSSGAKRPPLLGSQRQQQQRRRRRLPQQHPLPCSPSESEASDGASSSPRLRAPALLELKGRQANASHTRRQLPTKSKPLLPK
mmetsp:Transcript_109204/g.326594  ORF Transcript_109204/g.326594 Transcript_109204/m.326594 type:complete len:97 (-) Transcript_109204:849-1139(-)